MKKTIFLLVMQFSVVILARSEKLNFNFSIAETIESSLVVPPSNPTFGSIVQNSSVCDGTAATFTVDGLIPNSESTIYFKIDNGPTQLAYNIVSNATGIGTFTFNLVLANNEKQ